MTLEIILNGEYSLDVNDDINVLLTYQIGDVRNFLQSNASFSKTISIAGTSNNNLAFRNLFDITNVSDYNPNKKVSVLVTDGGVVIFKGYLKVDSIKIDFEKKISYECTIYSEIADMITNLGQLKLSDISFSAYSHTYNIHNVTGSWETFIVKEGIEQPFQKGEGYVYPYIDYASGLKFENFGVMLNSVEFFKPALYAKTVLDYVFQNSSGYTYKSDFINSDYFKSLIVTPDATGLYIPDIDVTNAKCLVSQSGADGTPLVLYNNVGLSYTAPEYTVEFDNKSTGGNYDNGNNYNTILFKYVVPVGGQYNIEANVNFDGYITDTAQSIGGTNAITYAVHTDCNVFITCTRAGVEFIIDSMDVTRVYTGGMNTNGKYLSSTDTLMNVDIVPNPILEAGDIIQVKVAHNYRFNAIAYYSTVTQVTAPSFALIQTAPSYFHIELQSNNVYEGGTINFNNFLGTDLASDYLLSIGKMFNLYFEFDKDNPLCLIMEPRENFYNGNVIDWTYKLDRDNETENFTMAEITAANFLFTYKSDSDYYNNDYQTKTITDVFGQYEYFIDNDFISPTTQDKIELIFAPTPLINEGGTDKVISTIYNYDKVSTYSPVTSSKPRILFYGGMLPCEQWVIYDGFTGGTTTGGTQLSVLNPVYVDAYPYAGYLDNPFTPTEDLNFAFPEFFYYNRNNLTNSNLFNKFWKTSIDDITDKTSSLFTGYFKLNTADIVNLSFRNIIFLDGQYWIINKIIDYNPLEENLTKVELLRLINYGQTSQNIDVKQQSINLNLGTVKVLNADGTTNAVIGAVAGNQVNNNLITGQINTVSSSAVNNVVAGSANNLTSGLGSAIIAGNRNIIAGNSGRILVIGNDNSSATQLVNSIIVGDNITGATSNAVNANNINLITNNTDSGNIAVDGNTAVHLSSSGITVYGSIIQNINFITGGVDVVADEFPPYTTINFISAGRDRILGFGTHTIVNFISAGRNTV